MNLNICLGFKKPKAKTWRHISGLLCLEIIDEEHFPGFEGSKLFLVFEKDELLKKFIEDILNKRKGGGKDVSSNN